MNFIRQFAISSLLLLTTSQFSMAMMVKNQAAPGPISSSGQEIIERGGTINAIDFKKKTIVINEVKYVLSTVPVSIHAPLSLANDNKFMLAPGMLVRFNTSKKIFSAQDQVLEIWVTRLSSKPTEK